MLHNLHYREGDVTNPIFEEDFAVVAHVCNDKGGWGKGVSGSISQKWKNAELNYKQWHKKGFVNITAFHQNDTTSLGHVETVYVKFELGNVQFVQAEDNICIANMLAQSGYSGLTRDGAKVQALDTNALYRCLNTVGIMCRSIMKHSGESVSVHMPCIGAGLGGARWIDVEEVIVHGLLPYEIPVIIYQLGGKV